MTPGRPALASALLIGALVAPLAHAQPGPHAGVPDGGLAESVIIADYGGNWYTVPTAINNRGQIAGWASREDGEWVAFLRSPRGDYGDIAARAFPRDINDRGDVVGILFPCSEETCWQEGFFWSDALGLQNLGPFLPAAVNDRGDMAGVCDGLWQACVMKDGVITVVAGRGSEARGINARGDVVGIYGDNRAFHVSADWQFTDLGRAVASGINDRGVIAGNRWVDLGQRGERAVLTAWTRDGPVSPAREVGIAIAINRKGWVIAYGYDESEASFAYVWDPETNRRLLLASAAGGWIQIEDINDRGAVIGRTEDAAVIWQLAQRDLGAPARGRR